MNQWYCKDFIVAGSPMLSASCSLYSVVTRTATLAPLKSLQYASLRLLLCGLLATVSACSLGSRPAGGFHASTDPGDEQSSLYVYRTSTVANTLYSTEVSVDESIVFNIDAGQLRHLKLATGPHRIELHTKDSIHGRKKINIDMQAGETYYLKITTSLKLGDGTNYQPYERRFDLQPVDARTAITQINNCCYTETPAATLDKQSESAQKERPGEGNKAEFSIDKTSNPFSH